MKSHQLIGEQTTNLHTKIPLLLKDTITFNNYHALEGCGGERFISIDHQNKYILCYLIYFKQNLF